MVFVVLGMPFGLLGVLFTMDVVEHWVAAVPPVPPAQAEVRSLIPEQRGGSGSNDPLVVVSRGPIRQPL